MSGRNTAPVVTRNYRASTEAMSHAVELLLSNVVLFDSQPNKGDPDDLTNKAANKAATKAASVSKGKKGQDRYVRR
jgi:hypothetical protein